MLLRDSLPKFDSKLRFLHGNPSLGSVDIYVSGNLVGSNIEFGDITNYNTFSPSSYILEVFKSGTYDSPIFKKNIEVVPNSIETLSLVKNNGETDLFKLKDSSSKGGKEISFLRFLNISPNAPLMTLSLQNIKVLFKDVEYVETTGYYPLSPGVYTFKISFSGANAISKTIKDVVLLPGEFQSLYVIGLLNGEPQLGYLLQTDG
ncbi:DUF4397 domain-containing protein [Clostridium sp. LY3-2]|uniref:DUF4397 domain-containing protein n=1 Tax=Clostridium sp. LY3-2 TaxID=2942482 RepID=UPI0021529F2A|nr:DUF4397 domain-containing protein [Clostridium sp. LY3-2]MCR6513633.1 DUF4397 domain-containing protein [Clostridium sp. LY3-2]